MNKKNALAIISLLGEDVKQPNKLYRFCVYTQVLSVFILLHTSVKSFYCYLQMSSLCAEFLNVFSCVNEQLIGFQRHVDAVPTLRRGRP